MEDSSSRPPPPRTRLPRRHLGLGRSAGARHSAYNELIGEGAPASTASLRVLRSATWPMGICAIGRRSTKGSQPSAASASLTASIATSLRGTGSALDRPCGEVLTRLTPAAADRSRFRRQARRVCEHRHCRGRDHRHVDLDSSRSDKETIHLALSFENGAPAYEPATPSTFIRDDPAYVDELLKLAGLAGDEKLAAISSSRATSRRCRSGRSKPMPRRPAITTSRRSSPTGRRASGSLAAS